jgi:hypothetical protein
MRDAIGFVGMVIIIIGAAKDLTLVMALGIAVLVLAIGLRK